MRHLLKMLFLLVLVGVLFGCSGPPTDPPASEPNESVEQETSSPEGSSTDNSGADVEPSETAGAMGSSSGETQQLAAAVIAPEGGTIIVEHPGDVLDGLAIDVPQDAYQDDAEFSVSSRPFTGALPEGVSVLTPVIEVKNGGEYAADVITVTVPIELPDDHFAMGFFLHEDGSLEGMPLVELQSGSITVATMHFSEFLIAAIANTVLEESVDTGYRPGQDDWQFPNYGSAISPEGNCAGMSISAMWYYTERHLKGAPRLHGLYDNSSGNEKTPDIWLDDSLGYRLASSVQADMDWVGNKIQPLFRTLGSVSDEITWKCFLFSMQLTGEPQFIYIRSTDGGAHAMVAYAADVERRELMIADPNYREQSRYISIVDGTFVPYMSAKSFAEALAGRFKSYDIIRYAAKSSVVPWPTVKRRWRDLDAGYAGGDRFPLYSLSLRTSAIGDVDVEDGMETGQELLALELSSMDGVDCTVIRGDRVLVESTETHMIPLTPGENLLGFLVHRDVVKDGETHADEYVDFQWARINRTSATYEIKLEVQMNATIERVNAPNPDAGYEGETNIHDTPFEKVTILAYAPGERTGSVYSARWENQPDPDPEIDGIHTGYVEVVVEETDEGMKVVQFEGFDELKYTDGGLRTSVAGGEGVSVMQTEDDSLLFQMAGEAVMESIYGFRHDWAFASRDTRKVIRFRGDDYSVIRITIR